MNYIIVVVLTFMCLIILQTRADFELLILHSNDLRFRIKENVGELSDAVYGGFARISSLVKEAKLAISKDQSIPSSVLYLNAGDTYLDSIWQSSTGFNVMIDFLNILNPDVSCLGQHDLNHIAESIYPFVRNIKYPLIVANLHFKDDYLKKNIKPSIVLDRNNKKIGLIGYVSTTLSYSLLPNASVEFEDEIIAIKRESGILKSEGVDIIIALGYSGFEIDRRIASEIYDVDVVVGGFTNTFLWNELQPNAEEIEGPYPTIVYQKFGKTVPVVQTYGFAKYLGRLRLRFNDTNHLVSYKGDPIFLKKELSQDLTILSMLNSYDRTLRQEEEENVVLGQSIVPLSAENASTAESNLANFVTDCLLEYARVSGHIQSAALALINAGAFKGKIDTSRSKPNITRKMLHEVLPYFTRVVVLDIQGKYIVEALEKSLHNLTSGTILHIGGGRYMFDMSKALYHRITSIRVLCMSCAEPLYENLQFETHYTLVTTENVLNGGKEYESLKEKGILKLIGDSLIDVIIDSFRAFGIIKPECDDRLGESGLLLKAGSTSYLRLRRNIFNYYYLCGLLVLLIVNIKYTILN